MRAGGYSATEKPYVNCGAGREPDANKYAILYEHNELSRMRNSAISQILRPTKTDAGGGPETGMQVGMALS